MNISSTIGLFGAGHLGQTIARSLLEGGVDRRNVRLCHGDSLETRERLKRAGLDDLVTSADELCSQSKILLYLVRPMDFKVIEKFSLPEDCLFISFLGGVSLSQIPVPLAEGQRVRVMPSAPDTIRSGKGLAATYPSDNIRVKALLSLLSLRQVALKEESEIHAFTGLGLCLPIALTYWDSLGKVFDETEYIKIAEKHALPDPVEMIDWARSVQMKGLTEDECQSYLKLAATPGGVTEAVLKGISQGDPLHLALEKGLLRSKELSEAKVNCK